jgi:hypothetical protein
MEVDGIPYGYSLQGLKFSNPSGLGVVGVGWVPTIVENGPGIELAETSATLDIIGIVVELFKAMDPNVGMACILGISVDVSIELAPIVPVPWGGNCSP